MGNSIPRSSQIGVRIGASFQQVVGSGSPPLTVRQSDRERCGRHRRTPPAVVPATTPRRAAIGELVGDGGGVDAAHHLEAEQQADDRGADVGGVGVEPSRRPPRTMPRQAPR